MKMPKLFLRKVLLGAVLIALATCITMFIKETLDTQDPESSLPILNIVYAGEPLPATTVYRAGYEWNFFTTIEKQTPSLTQDDLPLTIFDVAPSQPLTIQFSKEPSDLRIFRTEGRYSTDYIELASNDTFTITTPSIAGTYVYRLQAEWMARGSIQYYFCIKITDE